MGKLAVASISAIQIFLTIGLLTAGALADKGNTSNFNVAGSFIKFEDNRVYADIDRVPLGAVVEEIEKQTGTSFTVKDPAIFDYPLSIQLKEASLEDALKRIFKHYSYVAYFESDGSVDKVVIFGAKPSARSAISRRVDGAAGSQSRTSAPSSTISIAAEESESSAQTGNSPESLTASRQSGAAENTDHQEPGSPDEPFWGSADIPYDLDEYQALPDDLAGSDPGVSEPDVENSQGMHRTVEEQLRREARLNQARLERSLNALNSEHAHLRSMAVEELVKVKDPRATTALAVAASAKNNFPQERRQAAEALWHQAADHQFADENANSALVQLSEADDPEVRNIARRALTDMERYQRRTAGN